MIIRIAQFSDLEEIVTIYNQAVKVGQKTADTEPITIESRHDWFSSHLPEKHPIIVAEIDSSIVGWISLSPYRSGRKALTETAEVSCYIHNNYHRLGIASALLSDVIRLCPSLDISTIFAILLDTNIGSYKLLEKFGFDRWGHLPEVANFNGIKIGHYYYGFKT